MRPHLVAWLLRCLALTCALCLAWPSIGERRAGSGGPVLLAAASPDANRLLEDLMSTYNRLVRPVQNNSERVVVWLSLELSRLIDVNLKEQIMETNIWLKQEWYDHKLKWDPSEYGGIEDMSVPAEQIWLPDIVLYNSAEGYFAVSIMTRAQVHFDGRINWNPPAIFRSSCHIDITHFPFDTQNCKLKFGSWTFGPLLDLRHRNETEGPIERGIELKNYHQNVEWDIMEASARRNVEIYSCCPNDPYLDVTFYLILRRKPLFYTINLIVPCIVITALSLLVFFLPSDSGEKVTLTISILVSLIFFLSVLIETIPSTSLAMPLLGKYLVFTMILITLSVCATVCVLNIHFRTPSTHKMSPWIKRWFINILPKYLLLNTTHSQQSSLLPEHLIYPPNQAYIVSQQAAPQPTSSASNHSPPKLSLNTPQPMHQLNVKSLRHQEQQVSPNVSHDGSSLFLPYLQSEAARRLQMQRSRSSDRDQKSTSDLVGASSSIMMNHYCDNKWARSRAGSCRNYEVKDGKRQCWKLSQQEAKSQPFGRLFGGKGKRKKEKEKEEKKGKKSDATHGSTTTRNNYELYQQSSSSVENDYRHHTHFLARASVCQTNLWRMGPTRRCSQVAPLDYPTYYRPSQPLLSSMGGGACIQQQLIKPSSSSHHFNHLNHQHLLHNLHQCQYHHYQPTRAAPQERPLDIGSAEATGTAKTSMPKCGAVSALVSGSAESACQMSSSSSLLRPQHQHPQPSLFKVVPAWAPATPAAASAITPTASIRPKSGAPQSHYQTASTAREHLAPRPANSSLECTTNLSWIKDEAGDDSGCQYQKQQQHLRQQMLPLSQLPQADHANPPAAPINLGGPNLNSSIQHTRSGVKPVTDRPTQTQKQQQPSVDVGDSARLTHSRSSHHSLGAGLYTLPMDNHLQQIPSSGAYLSGSVRGGPSFVDSKSPAPLAADKLLWQHDVEFPPPPSFDCDFLDSNHNQKAQCLLPRSRSTDHRLHKASSYYKQTIDPQSNTAAKQLPATHADNRWPGDWQNHHSIGRALGQAYLQRLQPNCSLKSPNEPHPPRMSRSAMYEARQRMEPHTQSRYSRVTDCSFDALGRSSQSCSMPRSKSQVSLERLVRCSGNASAPSNPQVLACRQSRLLGHHNQPCNLYHQQSSTLQAQSRNLAPMTSGTHNKASCGACGSFPLATGTEGPQKPPQAVSVQSGELIRFSQELDKAIENAMFIAQHIDNLDEFESVKENWKYIAMVIDRIFLIVFLIAGFIGSVAIFAMVPWSYYTKHSPIDLHLAHLNALNLTEGDIYYKSCP